MSNTSDESTNISQTDGPTEQTTMEKPDTQTELEENFQKAYSNTTRYMRFGFFVLLALLLLVASILTSLMRTDSDTHERDWWIFLMVTTWAGFGITFISSILYGIYIFKKDNEGGKSFKEDSTRSQKKEQTTNYTNSGMNSNTETLNVIGTLATMMMDRRDKRKEKKKAAARAAQEQEAARAQAMTAQNQEEMDKEKYALNKYIESTIIPAENEIAKNENDHKEATSVIAQYTNEYMKEYYDWVRNQELPSDWTPTEKNLNTIGNDEQKQRYKDIRNAFITQERLTAKIKENKARVERENEELLRLNNKYLPGWITDADAAINRIVQTVNGCEKQVQTMNEEISDKICDIVMLIMDDAGHLYGSIDSKAKTEMDNAQTMYDRDRDNAEYVEALNKAKTNYTNIHKHVEILTKNVLKRDRKSTGNKLSKDILNKLYAIKWYFSEISAKLSAKALKELISKMNAIYKLAMNISNATKACLNDIYTPQQSASLSIHLDNREHMKQSIELADMLNTDAYNVSTTLMTIITEITNAKQTKKTESNKEKDKLNKDTLTSIDEQITNIKTNLENIQQYIQSVIYCWIEVAFDKPMSAKSFVDIIDNNNPSKSGNWMTTLTSTIIDRFKDPDDAEKSVVDSITGLSSVLTIMNNSLVSLKDSLDRLDKNLTTRIVAQYSNAQTTIADYVNIYRKELIAQMKKTLDKIDTIKRRPVVNVRQDALNALLTEKITDTHNKISDLLNNMQTEVDAMIKIYEVDESQHTAGGSRWWE